MSSLVLGFPFCPFSLLIFFIDLTAATLSGAGRKHICTKALKDDSPCHLKPNRSVEAEWVGTVRPFPKALMINEKNLEVCKHGFCCCCSCCFCLAVFLGFWFFILHLGFAIVVTHEQCRTTMLGHSILALFHPLLVTVMWQKAHLHTHRRHKECGGAPGPQTEAQTPARAVQKEFYLHRMGLLLWAAALWVSSLIEEGLCMGMHGNIFGLCKAC